MPYKGPVLVPTREETTFILSMLKEPRTHSSPLVKSLRQKCETVLASDPKWRAPTK